MMRYFGWMTALTAAGSMGGLALLIFVLFLVSLAGTFVGSSPLFTTIYVVATLVLAWGFTIFGLLAGWEMGGPNPMKRAVYAVGSFAAAGLLSTIVFAIPSSFVSNEACHRGTNMGSTSLRGLPVMFIMKVFVVPATDQATFFTCLD